ncbi:hypothetical protein CR513_42339, partial [Mucuna pruriens]
MEAPLLKGWRGLYLEKYDDTSDLNEHLANYVTQGDGKPLRFFMARFLDVCMKICNFNPKVALHCLLMALKLGLFSNNLHKDSPRNMDDLRTRVTNYI